MMKRVILESPYAGDIPANIEYARRCVRDSLSRGEAPIASHLLYTQPGILRDEVQEERMWGISAGLVWRAVADVSAFYTDRGWSGGMLAALNSAILSYAPISLRALDGPVKRPACLDEEMDLYIDAAIEKASA